MGKPTTRLGVWAQWVVMLMVAAAAAVVGMQSAQADTMQDRFEAANGHYFNEEWAEARDGYQDLLTRYQLRDPVLFFNLGDAYYQLGELGQAVLAYKRALDANSDAELERKIRDNLDRTREALIDRHRKDVSKAVTVLDETHGAAYSLFHLLPEAWTSLIFLGLWLVLMATLIARRLGDHTADRRGGLRTVALSLLIPTALAGILLVGNVVTTSQVVRGIVVGRDVQMRDGRHHDAPRSDVPEGLEVRLVDTADPAETRIRLSNGKEGWVPAEAVEAL